MLWIVRAAKPTATAAVAVATAAAFRQARATVPLHRNSSSNNSINKNSSNNSNNINNKLGWHDVGGERGLQGEPLVGIETDYVEPPLAHWEKRSHALLGLLVARCV